MKTKKVKKVLNLNKTTIARLDKSEARKVNGGKPSGWTRYSCADVCP